MDEYDLYAIRIESGGGSRDGDVIHVDARLETAREVLGLLNGHPDVARQTFAVYGMTLLEEDDA